MAANNEGPTRTMKPPTRPLDVEERTVLLLLLARYPIDADKIGPAFANIFIILTSDFAGQAEALTERLLGDSDDAWGLWIHLHRRALHDDKAEQTAWMAELNGDIDNTMKGMGIREYELHEQALNLSSLGPCKHTYTPPTAPEGSSFREECTLHFIKTKFAFDSREAAALMQAMFDTKIQCDRPVCDGYATYFDNAHSILSANFPAPIWKLTAPEPETAEMQHGWWNRIEASIVAAAEKTGVSVTYACTEPRGSPRVLRQMQEPWDGEVWSEGGRSPYEQWEDDSILMDEESEEMFAAGEVSRGVGLLSSSKPDAGTDSEVTANTTSSTAAKLVVELKLTKTAKTARMAANAQGKQATGPDAPNHTISSSPGPTSRSAPLRNTVGSTVVVAETPTARPDQNPQVSRGPNSRQEAGRKRKVVVEADGDEGRAKPKVRGAKRRKV